MAEQAVSSVASAVVGQITDRTFSTVMRKLRAPATSTHEKLQRLEMLLLRIRSAIEVSEKHAITSRSLLRWRKKLRKAADEADQVLRGFQQRAAAADEQKSSSEGSSSRSNTSLAVSFTWSALSGVARRMHGATMALFSSDQDMEKLNSTLENLEKISPNIQEFITLLNLEVSPKLKQRPAKRSKRPEMPGPIRSSSYSALSSTLTSPSFDQRSTGRTKEADTSEEEIIESAEALVMEQKILATKLQEVLFCMGRDVNSADERNLKDFEWLSLWTAVLREAQQRRNAVVGNIFAGCETADDIYGLARTVDRLAWDLMNFNTLVCLCPWNELHDP